jgi:predicted dehydrogenase
MSSITRRRFLEDSMLATAALAAVAQPTFADEKSTGNPSNKVRVAVLGCRIRGKAHVAEITKIPDCEIAYVCDPDHDLAGELATVVEGKQGKKPQAIQDMRRVFDDKSIGHNISEGRRIVQTSRKTGRICQGGTQNRSNAALMEALDYMHAGKIGEVKLARSVVYGRRASIGPVGKYELPSNVDYDLWAGPAPLSPLNRPQLHYDWHWNWQTGNGELGNNNIHSLDICRWGLGLTGLGQGVISYGGRFGYKDAGQTPNTQVCIFDFGDKTIVSETRGLKCDPYRAGVVGGWVFHGSEGSIAGTSLFDPDGKLVSTFKASRKIDSHFANFINVVRSRKREDLKAEILEGHQSTALCHMGNISWRLGSEASPAEVLEQVNAFKVRDNVQDTLDRTVQHLRDNQIDLDSSKLVLGAVLKPDSDREVFIDNSQANAMLSREYRKPFVVPAESAI